MARNTGPRRKYERRFGLLTDEKSKRLEKKFSRKSGYGLALEEKQKMKFIYDIREKQLRRYVEQALKSKENPGEKLLLKIQTREKLLLKIQTRLDNVVYLLGFALTRRQARQIVGHGHVLVNGKKVDIPSFNVKAGDEIRLTNKWTENPQAKEILTNSIAPPSWLQKQGAMGKVSSLPDKNELPQDIDATLIIESYSR